MAPSRIVEMVKWRSPKGEDTYKKLFADIKIEI
jgi:hypothetical protein